MQKSNKYNAKSNKYNVQSNKYIAKSNKYNVQKVTNIMYKECCEVPHRGSP